VTKAQDLVQASVVDRRGDLLTVGVRSPEDLPVVGALVEGVGEDGEVIATLVLRKRVEGGGTPLAVLEVVTGDAALVVSTRWPVWRTPNKD